MMIYSSKDYSEQNIVKETIKPTHSQVSIQINTFPLINFNSFNQYR